MKKRLKSENLSNSEKQTLCNLVEQLVEKPDEVYAEWMQIIKPKDCTEGFVDLSDNRSYYRDLIKQYELSKYCGNQTSLVSSKSAGDKDPNGTVIDTKNGAKENADEKSRCLFQAFCNTWTQKRTQYCQLTIIEKTTGWRNGA